MEGALYFLAGSAATIIIGVVCYSLLRFTVPLVGKQKAPKVGPHMSYRDLLRKVNEKKRAVINDDASIVEREGR